MKKLALFLAVLMLGCSTAAQAQMAATRDAQYIAVLRAVVNYKIDDDENIRNIERLREDRRFNEKVQKMLDKLAERGGGRYRHQYGSLQAVDRLVHGRA